tara:strand:+ start:861 stop:1052 length:192 start_codon:yes stop_codon:yes gene_type:complete
MTTYLISLTISFFASTVILALINYKLVKSLKRAEDEAQYWVEVCIKINKANKENSEGEYEEFI